MYRNKPLSLYLQLQLQKRRLTKYLHFDHIRCNKAQSCDTPRTMAELKVTVGLKCASPWHFK